MDNNKVGKLIAAMRQEKNMTQKELADTLNISDRTVSKWECGNGFPDLPLLHKLSEIFNVDIEKILNGDLSCNHVQNGNMKNSRFYVCPQCGNILFSSTDASISCCGRKLSALSIQHDNSHVFKVEQIQNEFYITALHEMTKQHFISFVAAAASDAVIIRKLYPEQNAEIILPRLTGAHYYGCCNEHGLFKIDIK